MSTWSLQGEVEQILQVLSSIPGSDELHVKTKRYPRFLPADTGAGFEERSWHLLARDVLNGVPIPRDSEDVSITWKGSVGFFQSADELRIAIAAALEKLDHPLAWDYDVRKDDTEIHVFRRF